MKTQSLNITAPMAVGRKLPAILHNYAPVKRALDIAVSLGLILFFAPLMLLISIGIKISSPGPILYRQTRIGKRGKPFRMLKFRSMQVVNNPDLHREYVQKLIKENTDPQAIGKTSVKLIGDPRITGVGKYLRKFSLDELPQFFNVLSGEMALVGPRPPLPYEYEVYQEWHKQRLNVSPGITGLWQVKAHNTVAFDDMVRLDIEYMQTTNLWLDLKIMALTPVEMVRGKGSG